MLQEKSELVSFQTVALYPGSLLHKEIGSEPGNTVVSCSAIHTRPDLGGGAWMAEYDSTRIDLYYIFSAILYHSLLFSAILPTYYHSAPFRLLKQNVTKTMWNSWNKLILKEKGIV